MDNKYLWQASSFKEKHQAQPLPNPLTLNKREDIDFSSFMTSSCTEKEKKKKEKKKKGEKKERKKREDETNPSAPLSSRLYKTIPTKKIAQSSHCSHIPLSWCKITKRIKYQNKKAEWPEDLFCKLHGKQRLVSGYATPTWTVKVISRQNLFTVPVMRHCLWRGNTKQITKVR